MKNLIFILSILIILFKTGNVLSDNNIFNVNNIEISKENSKNREKLVDQAFRSAFDKLSRRLLLDQNYKQLSSTSVEQIKKLVSYYQIINSNKNNKNNIIVNIFFDKDSIHNFFYAKNILYSDITSTDVIIFPLLKKKDKHFIYTQNYFYKNWNKNPDNLIQYSLPLENIESIQKINSNINNILDLNISDFFEEYAVENIVFATIDLKEKKNTEIFLSTRIEGKKINKTLSIERTSNLNEKEFQERIIFKINTLIEDLIKSQNLIDVRTPSFLNVKVKLNKKNNLVEFDNRLKKIDLVDDFYVQRLNKDFVLIKIKFLGKIKKIIRKFKDQKLNLKMTDGQWEIEII